MIGGVEPRQVAEDLRNGLSQLIPCFGGFLEFTVLEVAVHVNVKRCCVFEEGLSVNDADSSSPSVPALPQQPAKTCVFLAIV